MKPIRNASLHDRLNREMFRHEYGGWTAWTLVLAVLALFAWWLVPQPLDVSHRTGTVTGVTTLMSESGPRIRIGVDLDGHRIEAATTARFVAPENGATICLRHSIGQWTGAETFTQTDMRFCDGSNSTPGVD